MLSIQHILCGISRGRTDSEYLAASVFPDAIRAYTGRREYTHFEENAYMQEFPDEPEKWDISYWQFPSNMKTVTPQSVKTQLQENGHLAKGIHPAAIGELTHLEEFVEHNQHLPAQMFLGCKDHLTEDRRFDTFIRTEIDCRKKEQDIFYFQHQEYDGKGVRTLINQIEQHGIYLLAHDIYNKTGMLCNQEWLEQTIKPILDAEYPKDLAEKTFSFMRIDPEINEWITNKDWSHLDTGLIAKEKYDTLYGNIMADMWYNRTLQSIDRGLETGRQLELQIQPNGIGVDAIVSDDMGFIIREQYRYGIDCVEHEADAEDLIPGENTYIGVYLGLMEDSYGITETVVSGEQSSDVEQFIQEHGPWLGTLQQISDLLLTDEDLNSLTEASDLKL